ncbi:MAG: hypothetical protein HYT64_00060 [Candidatus Yanofskybacteria bacterium]|nr:hypothetical protein [Candidatus Yanofskybacteria bacterium]
MTINEVREVVIDSVEVYKFIVAQLTDGNGGKRLVVRANESCRYHQDAFDLLRQEVRPHGLDVHCIGGGKIEISLAEKTVCVWDSSWDFGEEPNRKETIRMLQAAFPDYQVTQE